MKIRTLSNTIVCSLFILPILLVSAADAANKIMPLGDSITQGSSSGVVDEAFQVSFRKVLYDKLWEKGYVVDDEIFVGTQESGESVTDFDSDHEGHGGWTAEEIVKGRPVMDPDAGNLAIWLAERQPSIVLLHIGTNGVEESPAGVAAILDEIDRFEDDNGLAIWVVLARIINRSCSTDPEPSITCPESATTMTFNDNVEEMAWDRIDNPANPAWPDKIIIVDMEGGIEYDLQPVGDMWDNLHPYEYFGYEKMATIWFSGLMEILPQASAGPDQSVDEFETVTLDGRESMDPKSGNLSYQWVQTAGNPTVDLSDAQAQQPIFKAPDAGLTVVTLTFTLTVTDADELVSTDTVDITVVKIQPLADAGPLQTVNGSATVELDASGSEGVGLAYKWRQLTGTNVVLSDDTAIRPTFVADVDPSGETLTFELTVTDEDDLESADTVDIIVTMLPQADAGPDQSVDESDNVTLDASGSIAAGALSYRWTQTAGTEVDLSDDQAVRPTFIAPDVAPGSETLTFRLTVTDEDNLESTDMVNIIVNNHTSSESDSGGGGGGGGCFITTAADSSQMALLGNVLRELRSRFAMVNWKQLMAGNISLATPRAEHAAKPAFMVTMFVLISACAAITLRESRKRRLKL